MSTTAEAHRMHAAITQALHSTSDEMTLSEALGDILSRHAPTKAGECSTCREDPDSHWGVEYPCEDVRIIADAFGVGEVQS